MAAPSQFFESSFTEAISTPMPGRQRVGAIRHIPATPTVEVIDASSAAATVEDTGSVMKGIQWALGLEIAAGVFLFGLWRLCHLLF